MHHLVAREETARPDARTSSSVGGSLSSIQLMRGVAALLVVLFHTGVILARPDYGVIDSAPAILGRGWIGVNFFFVLSGFIIFLAHSRDIGEPGTVGRYIWRRFSRVYPVYWIFVTLFICFTALGFGKDELDLSLSNILTTYTLVQFNLIPHLPLKVAWTLLFEVSFYAMFATLIIGKRFGILVFIAWLASIVFHSMIMGEHEWGISSIWNINFFFGAAVFGIFRYARPKFGLPLLILGLGMLAIYWTHIPLAPDVAQGSPSIMLSLAAIFAMILLGATLSERHFEIRIPKVFLLLGEASYAIYLVHSAAISFLAVIIHRFPVAEVPRSIVFSAVAIAATLGGVAAHLMIERPTLKLVRKWREYGPTIRRARASSAR